jgi:tetratricopeptide (TPR) repeat protein
MGYMLKKTALFGWFLFVLGVLVLVICLVVYIYRDLRGHDKVLLENSMVGKESLETETSKPVEVVKSQDIRNEVIEVSNKMEVKEIPLPELDQKIVNSKKLDQKFFEIATKNINDLTSSLKEDPNSEEDWLRLSLIRKMIGDYSSSIEILKYVTKRWPKDYVPYSNLADIYQFYAKDKILAEENLLRVIELKSDYPDSYQNLYLLYTTDYIEKKPKALDTLVKGLGNNPHSSDIMTTIARHYRANKDYDNAKKYYNMAIDEAKLIKSKDLELSVKAELSELK